MRIADFANLRYKLKTTILAVVLGFLANDHCLRAQVISDETTNTKVNTTDNLTTITGGARAGSNLFHSFDKFSIPLNEIVRFNNLAEIENIFSRITGGSISKIEGEIATNGNANLFLLNPAGIIFGANARLDVGGSFFATTGESVIFDDGTEFSAVTPTNEPILTVTAPIGLQYGEAAGAISILDNDNRPASSAIGLSIKPRNTLALLGNNISIARNDLGAVGGSVELGSVAAGKINLQINDGNWLFDYTEISQFSQIDLIQTRIISNGTINLRGESINLAQGSGINNFTQTDGEGGIVNLQAEREISLNSSSIFTQVGQIFGTQPIAGRGGDITIDAREVSFSNGSFISAGTLSQGAGGDISIDAKSIVLSGGSINPSVIATSTQGIGDGGQITLNTERLSILDGSQIQALGGEGAGGTIAVNATDSIRLFGSGKLISRNEAGEIIETIGNSGISASAGISSLSEPSPTQGKSGNLIVTTPKLQIEDNAQISVSNFGVADAGNIEIDAVVLDIATTGKIVANTASGKGGEINLNIDESLILQSGAGISTTAGRNGNGGNIAILTDNLVLLDSNNINADAQNGDGGNIRIQARGFFIDADSSITASSDFGLDGVVDITTLDLNSKIETKQPEPLPLKAENYITTGCSLGQDFTANQFRNIGRGGLPSNIMSETSEVSLLSDLGDENFQISESNSRPNLPELAVPKERSPIEASTWKINRRGNLELVALNANAVMLDTLHRGCGKLGLKAK